jgi:dipeptidyl aminopeptidase/acylaminoacyl peptidase/menaquinone-dependent protoporphyrinogen IX oxidase
VSVREDHRTPGEAVNAIVAVHPGSSRDDEVLVSGGDFYASPRISPDGSRLAWLAWNHPDMPWDAAELWVAPMGADGSLGTPERVAGSSDESVVQPEWSPDGVLHFISDRTDWWNIYRLREGRVEPLTQLEAEFAAPQWLFRMSTYGFDGPGRLICAFTQKGVWRLAALDVAGRDLTPIDTPYNTISYLRVGGGRAAFVGGAPAAPSAVVLMDLKSGRIEELRRSSELRIDPGCISAGEAMEFPTEGGLTAHAFFYPPRNKDFTAPVGEKPPLVVMAHGGPTGAASAALRLNIQYYTSRGIAVLDVNYGGSSGFGRRYRRRLWGQWGVVDVDDCINGVKRLAERGVIDGARLAITGGSAGGYTVLCCVTFRDAFKAGASHYGISDLEALVRETHKFESRYFDRLVGPCPARRDLYVERSPIHHVEGISCPVVFFQGLEDRVVPANQARMLADALREKGLPVAHVEFEGEQHGFRRAENIRRALEGELYFFSRVFGFEPAGRIEPIPIENMQLERVGAGGRQSTGRKILVAYATRHGSTEEVARAVGVAFSRAGHRAVVRPVEKVEELGGYSAVILGSPLYSGRMLPELEAFAKRHREEISRMPSAVFVTCLTMTQPTEKSVRKMLKKTRPLVELLRPRDVGLFAGVVNYADLGFFYRFMFRLMKIPEGDFRNWEVINRWAKDLVPVLTKEENAAGQRRTRSSGQALSTGAPPEG